MTDDERYKLRFGPYPAPIFRLGIVVTCQIRGEVTIVGITDARIPWPVGKTKRAKSLVIFAGLAEAIRKESNQAICHWWGVTPQTVTKWRKALGIGPVTIGTSELRRKHFAEPWAEFTRKKAWAKGSDPERRRKIAESKRGKPRPPHVIEAMNNAKLNRRARPQTP